MSHRQSAQVARSGMMSAVFAPPVLSRISNEVNPTGSSAQCSRLRMRAIAGLSCSSLRKNTASDGGSPSTSRNTPSLEFRTQPVRRNSRARRYTKGLKPTPCTAPRTTTRKRATLARFSSGNGCKYAGCGQNSFSVYAVLARTAVSSGLITPNPPAPFLYRIR